MSNPELHISWDDFYIATKKLADTLNAQDLKFDKIVAIARGGLIPAAILGQELNIRHIDTVCMASYGDEDHAQTSMTILKAVNDDAENILVVDDLSDSGKTFRQIKQMLPNAHRACIYAKPIGVSAVQTFIQEVPQDTWIYFPWENS